MLKLLAPIWRGAVVVGCALAFQFSLVPTTAEASCLPSSLKSKLAQIRSKFGSVRVISTYRRGARISGSGRRSYHASCRAVDFYPPRGKYRAVARWLRANHSGGVGTYSCGMSHIHIDNGPRIRFHKCAGKSIRRHRHAKRRHYRRRYARRAKLRGSYASRSRRYSRRKARRLAATRKFGFNLDTNSFTK